MAVGSRGAGLMAGDGPIGHTKPALLNFVVLDEDDLAVMSAHLQDADVAVRDMAHLTKTRRFALVVSRQDRCGAPAGSLDRCLTGFHFECVTKVSHLGVQLEERDRLLRLVAITFSITEAPSGAVMLLFQDGAVIKLDVECLEAEMHDLPPAGSEVASLDAAEMAG